MNHAHDTVTATRPDERKLGLLGTLFLWVAATLVTPTVMTGQMFIPDTSPITAFEVVVLGSLLGCLALGAIAAIGTKTGLTTFVFARQVFGTSGAKVFALLNLVILMGWGVIQGFLGGIALNQVLIALFNVDNIVLSILVTQGLVLVITLLGHTGIQKIEGWVSSLMLIVALSVIYYLIEQNGLTTLISVPLSESPALTYAIIFDIVLATAFSWMALPCDYNRYCRSVKVSVVGITSGYMLGTLLAMGLGILVASYSILQGFDSTYDPSHIATGGFAVAASLVMFLSVVTTNVMVLYSVTMSAMSISKALSFKTVVIGFGVIGMAASLLQDYLMASFFDWVLLVGAFMIPVFAILLVDYYVLKNRGDASVKTLNVRALISYVVAVVFSLYFTYWQPLDTGVTAFTFLLAGMLYLSLSLKLRANVQPLAKEL